MYCRRQNEIHKFLLNYRNTPHCTTTIAPAVLWMNRALRSKLPHISRESEKFKEAEKAKTKNKIKNEKYYIKRNMKISKVKKGHWVLVRQRKKNKLSTYFNASPMRVKEVKGSAVILDNDKDTVRNIKDVKIVPGYNNESDDSCVPWSEEESDDITSEDDDERGSDDEERGSDNVDSPVAIRPRREVRPPERYKDFVME